MNQDSQILDETTVEITLDWVIERSRLTTLLYSFIGILTAFGIFMGIFSVDLLDDDIIPFVIIVPLAVGLSAWVSAPYIVGYRALVKGGRTFIWSLFQHIVDVLIGVLAAMIYVQIEISHAENV